MKAQVQTRYQFTFTEDEYLTLAALVLEGQEVTESEGREMARIVEQFLRYAEVFDDAAPGPDEEPAESPAEDEAEEEAIVAAVESVNAVNTAKRHRNRSHR